MLRPLLACVLLLSACSSAVKRSFDATYDDVMAPSPTLSGPWQPDATVHLAEGTVRRALKAAITAADLRTHLEVPGLRVEPDLSIDALAFGAPTSGCGDCLGLTAELGGSLSYKGPLVAGQADLGARLAADVVLRTEAVSDGWVVTAALERLHDVEIALDGPARRLSGLAQGPLGDWLQERITEEVPPLVLARLGDLDTPLLGVGVRSADDGGLLLHLRTRRTDPRAVDDPPPAERGWTARVSLDSVLGEVRRLSFAAGAVQHGVWVDPVDLSLEDDRFTLWLRLWRPKGFGWWRDVQIDGYHTFRRGRLELVAEDVTEVDHSRGAGVADPLAALAGARILEGIQAAVNTSVPSSRTQDIAGVRTTWSLRTLTRDEDDLLVEGGVTFDTVAP